jgi:hypothetical protein
MAVRRRGGDVGEMRVRRRDRALRRAHARGQCEGGGDDRHEAAAENERRERRRSERIERAMFEHDEDDEAVEADGRRIGAEHHDEPAHERPSGERRNGEPRITAGHGAREGRERRRASGDQKPDEPHAYGFGAVGHRRRDRADRHDHRDRRPAGGEPEREGGGDGYGIP